MNAMKNKIKSSTGASITFALLLFLVCAVISSVVIIASTAAGGRVSQMAQMDQRYYAVNSAAELIRDVLEKQTVVVTTGTQTTRTVNENGDTVEEIEGPPLTKTVVVNNGVMDYPIPMTAISDSILAEAAYKLTDTGGFSEPYSRSETLSVDGFESLEVNVTETLNPNGRIIFNVSKLIGTSTGYTLQLTFDMDRSDTTKTTETQSSKTPTIDATSGLPKPGEYTMQVVRTETTESTFRWKMNSIKVLSSTNAA